MEVLDVVSGVADCKENSDMQGLGDNDTVDFGGFKTRSVGILALGKRITRANEAVGILQTASMVLGDMKQCANRLLDLVMIHRNRSLDLDEAETWQVEFEYLKKYLLACVTQTYYDGKVCFYDGDTFGINDEEMRLTFSAPFTDNLDLKFPEKIEVFIDHLTQMHHFVDLQLEHSRTEQQHNLQTLTQLTQCQQPSANDTLDTTRLKKHSNLFCNSHDTTYLQTKLHALLA
jgi:flagellin-like hook-associated protein FlgL